MRHSSAEFAAIAERGTILRVQVGSGLSRFEQYILRTQPEGHRSGPGDLDLIVYSLRKWVRLALQGNPTVLLPLFVPESWAGTPRTRRWPRRTNWRRSSPNCWIVRHCRNGRTTNGRTGG